ncbi:MAG: alpha/beta hydrolase [Rhodococcus sp. (in: high G+C Gram-positive bacteria)]
MEHLDVEFASGLRLDIVGPHAVGPRPAIVWLHGGGWRMQDRKARPDFAAHFAARGFVMVSIDYRLTPDTVFPGQLHDVRRALRFLRNRSTEFGIDRNRIGLWGSSAGGHLAALAGAHSSSPLLPGEEGEAGDASVQAVVDGYGPSSFADQADDSPEAALLGGPIRNNLELARAASPALQVRPGMPPFLILHGTADTMVPSAHSVRLHEALIDGGNDSTLYLVDDFGHGFLNPGDVLELGPGVFLDQGRLEANPGSRAEIHTYTTTHGALSMDTIADFFLTHLGQGQQQ